MPVGDYFQEYGPIHRRRMGQGPVDEEPVTTVATRPNIRPTEELETTRLQEEDQSPRPLARRRTRAVRRRVPHPFSWKYMLLISLSVFLVTLLVLPYGLAFYYADRAFPGITIQGMAVSDLDPPFIEEALAARYEAYLQQPIMLVYHNQTWQPRLAELGVTVDLSQTARQAFATGRTGDPLTRLRDLGTAWFYGREIAPQLVINEEQLQRYLQHIALEIEQPPSPPTLQLASGQALGTSGTDGVQLLLDETVDDVLLALQTLEPQDVALRTRTLTPMLSNDSLQEAQAQATLYISSAVVLEHGAQQWVWDSTKLAQLLRIGVNKGAFAVTINNDALIEEVEQLALHIDSGSVEPRLRLVDGALQMIQPGRKGWQLQQDAAVELIAAALHQGDPMTRTVVLPVDEIRPEVTPEMFGDLGIRELVGVGQSSFAGSAEYRITNIKAAAERTNGILIAPGEEFSFNTQLGPVDAEHGFVEGYAVVGNRTKLEWGGGVCQNATTVFRAAFWAGLPIVERHPHAFYISWYDAFGLGAYGNGAGLDAAIFTGVQDLRFLNDTSHWLLMQTTMNETDQVLTVEFYGSRPDREVTIEGPFTSNELAAPDEPVYIDDSTQPVGYLYQSDMARSGWDVSIVRIVTENGVESSRDTFVTRFKAWPDVFIRGTGG
ncbi:MAG: vanomycin resistance protein VanB [Chloroflexaceae bacterium]|nr:vanomycin resistance protein VanB [Chloroflexaceae bacterium]